MHPADVPFLGKLADNICLSGGAQGADTLWGECAQTAGHVVVHWSFDGHKSSCDNVYKLDRETLNQAYDHVNYASRFLDRSDPALYKPYVLKLILRNYYQVQYAQTIYAVSELTDNAPISENESIFDIPSEGMMMVMMQPWDNIGVKGGTAWAIQMYLDIMWKHRLKLYTLGSCGEDWNPPIIDDGIYFFCQKREKVYGFNPYKHVWYSRETQHTTKPVQSPRGIYAAVGSRDLKPSGEAFIRSLF